MKLLMILGVFFMGIAQAAEIDQSFTTSDGKKTTFQSYKGKPLLIVNIATKCGYTPQLSGLEKVYQKYKEKGLVVLGIPSNDFGGQTPEGDKDVQKFCQLRYGVTFPLAPKVSVSGENKSPLIQWLLSESANKKEIGWNFEKFLVGKDGKVIARYSSSVSPEDQSISKEIEKSL